MASASRLEVVIVNNYEPPDGIPIGSLSRNLDNKRALSSLTLSLTLTLTS